MTGSTQFCWTAVHTALFAVHSFSLGLNCGAADGVPGLYGAVDAGVVDGGSTGVADGSPG